jgi:hypothetical protein
MGSPWFHLSAALGSILFLAVVVSAVNQNLLYLSLLFALFVALACAVRSWPILLLTLFLFGYFSCVEADFRPLTFVDPLPNEPAGDLVTIPIPSNQSWRYHFDLARLSPRDTQAPLAAYLYIDGRDLRNLNVDINGQLFRGSEYRFTKLGIDHLAIPVHPRAGAALDIALKPLPGEDPTINIGPEISKTQVYPDAVWLEITNNRERLIFHARRVIAPR